MHFHFCYIIHRYAPTLRELYLFNGRKIIPGIYSIMIHEVISELDFKETFSDFKKREKSLNEYVKKMRTKS